MTNAVRWITKWVIDPQHGTSRYHILLERCPNDSHRIRLVVETHSGEFTVIVREYAESVGEAGTLANHLLEQYSANWSMVPAKLPEKGGG